MSRKIMFDQIEQLVLERSDGLTSIDLAGAEKLEAEAENLRALARQRRSGDLSLILKLHGIDEKTAFQPLIDTQTGRFLGVVVEEPPAQPAAEPSPKEGPPAAKAPKKEPADGIPRPFVPHALTGKES